LYPWKAGILPTALGTYLDYTTKCYNPYFRNCFHPYRDATTKAVRKARGLHRSRKAVQVQMASGDHGKIAPHPTGHRTSSTDHAEHSRGDRMHSTGQIKSYPRQRGNRVRDV